MLDIEIDIATLVADDVSGTADWRSRKAVEYPDDARNREAAEILEKIASDLLTLEGTEIHRRTAEAFDRHLERFSEELSELTRQVGFWAFPNTGTEFLEDLLSRLPD
jgi:hypothetical protein